MKKLFTLVIMACVSMAAMAQDASSWKSGQDVTEELQWQEYTGDTFSGIGTYWFGDEPGYDHNCWELYNKPANTEMYQVFWLPAGVYTFKAQALYRYGSAWAAGWDVDKSYGEIFCDAVNLDDEGNVASITFKNRGTVKSIVAEGSETMLLTEDVCPEDATWQRDAQTTNVLGYEGTTMYVPNSMWGTQLHFEAGEYWNEFRVIMPNDGYVKFGYRKTDGSIADDWLIWANARAVYESEINDDVLLDIRRNDLDLYFGEVTEVEDVIRDAGFYTLAALLDDALIEYNGEIDDTSLEGIDEAMEHLSEIKDQFMAYLADAKDLAAIVRKSESMLISTDYSGKEEFTAAVAAAKAVCDDDVVDDSDSPEMYSEARTSLIAARVAYMMTSEKVDGAWNFTGMVSYPFFCNDEYTPSWDGEHWIYSDYVLNGNAEEGLSGYSGVGESGDDNKTYKADNAYVTIASNVTIASGSAPAGNWYQVGTSSYEPYWNHQRSSAKQWATPGDRREIRQDIVGLPDGFYSAKGYGMTWGNDWSGNCDMGIFVVSGDNQVESTEDTFLSGWWNGWHDGDWNTYTTGLIQVTDGTLTVGFHANGFSSFTGMQLFYYGATPNFDDMIQNQYNAVVASLEELIWEGDNAAANTMLNAIKLPIESYDAYFDAVARLNEISAYVNTANTTIDRFNSETGVPMSYMALQAECLDAHDDAKAAIIEKAFNTVSEIGTRETDTYKDAIEAENIYNAYISYFRTYDKSLTFNSADLQNLRDEQTAYLKENYGSVEKLDEFEKALLAIINSSIFNSRGAENASESNPIDITDFLVNASLETSPNEGWTSEPSNIVPTINTYGRQTAEIWNTDAFDIYQVVKNLPEGAYEFRVRACYRDAGDVGSATGGPYNNWVYAAGEVPELWEQHNAQIYASCGDTEKFNYVKSVCDGKWTEPSFDTWYNMKGMTEEYEAAGHLIDWDGSCCVFYDELTDLDKEEEEYITGKNVINLDSPGYPFDSRVEDNGEVYYYPCSMAGFYWRTQKSPEAYNNVVQIMVPQGGDLRLGLRKTAAIGGDWLIYRNFELYYLGKDTPSSVNKVNVKRTSDNGMFNFAGQRVDASYKGFAIKNGKKYFKFK